MSYTKQVWNNDAVGGTPISAARLNNIEQGIFNADFLTCTSTTRPTTGLFDGMRIYETDTKAFGFYDATNSVWHMWDQVTQTFTPTFTTVSGGPTVGNGTITGSYRRMGRSCWIKVTFTMGSTSNGGVGNCTFGVPSAIAARNDTEQWIPMKMYTNGNAQNWICTAWFNNVTISPYAPASQTNVSILPMRSCDASAAGGTGVPLVSGNYTLTTGSNLVIEGVYELAAG
jgi:hypothetical protein